MDEFDIYIRRFLAGSESAAAGLQRVFGLDERRAFEFVQSLPRVVKRHVSGEQVARYERVLREIGAEFELRRSAIRPLQVIAVQGAPAAVRTEPDPEQHGSTLTLPPPQFALAPARPRTDSLFAQAPESTHPRHDPQFAQTLVQSGLPAALVDELARASAYGIALSQAAQGEAAHPPTASALGVPSLRPSARPPAMSGTLREGSPSSIAAAPPPPATPVWSSFLPVAASASPPALAPVWQAPPELAGALPLPPAAAVNDLPPRSQVPGLEPLQIGGRPAWLIDGRDGYQEAPEVASPGSAPLPPASGSHGASPPFARPRASAAPQAGLELDSAARVAAPAASRAAVPVIAPQAVAHYGQVEPEAPPLILRLGLRLGIGLSLFMIVTALRGALDRDVKAALFEWQDDQPAEHQLGAVRVAAKPPSAAGMGPPALEWMESELNQFINPDKDAVRRRVKKFLAAGALEVYVGKIMPSGPMRIGSELIVELPSDATKRNAVIAVQDGAARSILGGFAAGTSTDPGGKLFRVPP